MRFVPYEKLSKKQKRLADLEKRGTWYGVKPVSIKHKSRKVYTRKLKHKNSDII